MKRLGWSGLVTLLAMMLWMPTTGWAQGLKDYKEQKHTKRERVSSQDCPKKYIARCQQECGEDDAACRRQCVDEAPNFCERRSRRKVVKTAEVAAKATTLAAGAVAVMLENYFGEEPSGEVGPYTIIWNAPSAVAEFGGGLLTAGARNGTGVVQLRHGHVGVSGQFSHMWDQSDTMTEADFGPTLYMASASIIFGAQPSLLVSAGNDVETLYGVGVRTYTNVMLGRMFFSFDPMLGYINGQWNYHLRVGGGYRFTPGIYAKVGYDYRDILDLNDLDISQSYLQGFNALIGFRWN